MIKYVYQFSEGDASMRDLLGGKGANLAQMTKLGLAVPNGFTITTQACADYYDNPEEFMNKLMEEVKESAKVLEKDTNQQLGCVENPLLVSIRSGAASSMPGMMDTILNLGLNDAIVEEMAKDNPILAYDLYRRLIQMFGNVVMEIDMSKFDSVIEVISINSQENAKEVVKQFKEIYKQETGEDFPQDPLWQMQKSIEAVFKSWNNPRAEYYRKLNNITGLKGTAVNVQLMVFGNRNDNSATGVCFTRNPSTGEPGLYGEMLWNAQGEDIVAGTHTPLPIQELKDTKPEYYNELLRNTQILEDHYLDMQDIEFTIDDGNLYILQTRNGKRTPGAALQILNDLVEEGKITSVEALDRLDPSIVNEALHVQFTPAALASNTPLTKGLPASPGGASGKIAYSKEKVIELVNDGEAVILVRNETSPDDIEGMHLAKGILTAKGGMTSHAAVVTRGMGKPCIVGCDGVVFDGDIVKIGNTSYQEGDTISMDGTSGQVYDGLLEYASQELNENIYNILNWAKEEKTLKVYANADTPKDAKTAIDFFAEGIGLIRTEHMFFEHDRIQAMREMILSSSTEKREQALRKILPYQQKDFEEIFEVMGNLPMTIRYLDPPLHEFLPTKEKDIEELSISMNIPVEELQATIASLHEFNPMMGHRGCRLAITYPEIAEMQTEAIIQAAIEVQKRNPNIKVDISLMIPLVGDLKEYSFLHDIIDNTAKALELEQKEKVNYHIGTMIELPRACLLADKIATKAEFISFGTNDLTQMTFGFSRDDTHSFIPDYVEKDIYENDPFTTLDINGVGQLVQIAVNNARATNPNIKIGVCGEHGGDPKSIEFFKSLGLDYVSCSPYRVPVAIVSSTK